MKHNALYFLGLFYHKTIIYDHRSINKRPEERDLDFETEFQG